MGFGRESIPEQVHPWLGMGTEPRPVERRGVERGRNLCPLRWQTWFHLNILVGLGKSDKGCSGPALGSLQVAVKPSSWALLTEASLCLTLQRTQFISRSEGQKFPLQEIDSQGLTRCYYLLKKQRIHPGGSPTASVIWGPRQ